MKDLIQSKIKKLTIIQHKPSEDSDTIKQWAGHGIPVAVKVACWPQYFQCTYWVLQYGPLRRGWEMFLGTQGT
jgi:hypothetical protein